MDLREMVQIASEHGVGGNVLAVDQEPAFVFGQGQNSLEVVELPPETGDSAEPTHFKHYNSIRR
jgi:hypothetical protein